MDEILATEVIEVIEVVEQIDYSEMLSVIYGELITLNEFAQYLAGFGLFFVIVLLCFFAYKFFRIFF